jgi:signal transduction histidine kinase
LLLLSITCFSQDTIPHLFVLDSLPAQGVLLDKGWKFHPSDNMDWADSDFNDTEWQEINPTLDIYDLPQVRQAGMGWFRLHLSVNSSLRNKTIALMINQMGASEIYLNGDLIHRFGTVSPQTNQVQTYDPLGQPFLINLSESPLQVLAVRFATKRNIPFIQFIGNVNACLVVRVNRIDQVLRGGLPYDINFAINYMQIGLFLILALLHLSFFLFYPKQRANLYFFIFSFTSLLNWLGYRLAYDQVHNIEVRAYLLIVIALLYFLFTLYSLKAIYALFEHPKGWVYWALVTCFFISIPLLFWPYRGGYIFGYVVFTFLAYLESLKITIIGLKKKKRGARIIASGALAFLFFYIISNLIFFHIIPAGPNFLMGHISFVLAYSSLPISISLYLSLEFAFTSRSLEAKLIEVQQLSAQTIAQEQEKRQILATQNETLEKQVVQRTSELSHQKEELQSTLEHLKATQTQLIQSEKMASLGELTAGIAHEIQNPLNFVNNFSEVSRELVEELRQEHRKPEPDTDLEADLLNDLKQNLEKIHHHGKRADSIVKGMLQHSRASSGEKQPTDINTLVDEYLRLSYHGLRAKDKDFNAQFELKADPGLGKVEIVPQEIGRVLLNLFNNAFYAVNQKKYQLNGQYQPQVIVSTRKLGSKIEISVKDNGTGIPESVQQKIFQPFFTTKPTGEGTGLGLSLSYDIITKGHGGEIRVESKEGEGSEFVVYLPTKKNLH